MKPNFQNIFKAMRRDVSLSDYTSIELGGPARYFYTCEDPAELPLLLAWARGNALPVAWLGGGSNLLVPDEGYPGLVIKIGWTGIRFQEETLETSAPDEVGPSVFVSAMAGENWDDFVLSCVARGLTGVECLSGIPGLVGATPIQNVGAYGQEVAETIVGLRALEPASGDILEFAPEDCGFGYRRSRFKYEDRSRYVILEVDFRLQKNAPPAIRYGELARRLARDEVLEKNQPGPRQLMAVRQAVLELRAGKSMVLAKDDFNTRSCGSYFTNPVVSADDFASLLAKCLARGLAEPPHYEDPQGIKLPAAWLVEQAGFPKGYRPPVSKDENENGREADAGISTNHSLAIINLAAARGEAGSTAAVRELEDNIRARVLEVFGVELEREPVVLTLD